MANVQVSCTTHLSAAPSHWHSAWRPAGPPAVALLANTNRLCYCESSRVTKSLTVHSTTRSSTTG